MNRWVFLAGMALALAGCGNEQVMSGGNFTQSNGALEQTQGPLAGRQMVGVAADYVVVAPRTGGPLTLIGVIDAQAIEGRGNFVAVPGAVVVYPDGSTQTADGLGVFDSSLSSFAAANGRAREEDEDLPTAVVTLRPPSGSAFLAGSEQVLLPLAAEEATWLSGTYSFGDDPQLTTDPNGPNAPQVSARYQSHTNWPHTVDQYLQGGKGFEGFWMVGNKATQPDQVLKPNRLHKCSFRTSWNKNYVPYYARAGGPGNEWLEYKWTASWVGGDTVPGRLGGSGRKSTWVWTVTTEIEQQQANTVAVSAWPKWWEVWANGEAVDVTLFRHD